MGKNPSMVSLPIGILPHPQPLHAMPFKASHKRKGSTCAPASRNLPSLATLSTPPAKGGTGWTNGNYRTGRPRRMCGKLHCKAKRRHEAGVLIRVRINAHSCAIRDGDIPPSTYFLEPAA
jgi:hypothetical protein